MIETVVALLMLVNNEIKEHRIQVDGMAQCLSGKRKAERQYQENVPGRSGLSGSNENSL